MVDPPRGEPGEPLKFPRWGPELNRDIYWLLGAAQATVQKPGTRRKGHAVVPAAPGPLEHPLLPASDGTNTPHGAGLPWGPAMTRGKGHSKTQERQEHGTKVGSIPAPQVPGQASPATPSPRRSRGDQRGASPAACLVSLALLEMHFLR